MWSLLAASPNLNYPQNLPRQSMRFRCLPPANCILSKNRKTAGLYRQAAFSAIVALIILHHDLISIWSRSDSIWSHNLKVIWFQLDASGIILSRTSTRSVCMKACANTLSRFYSGSHNCFPALKRALGIHKNAFMSLQHCLSFPDPWSSFNYA